MSNRATLIGKIHKVLKKHYKPVSPTDRPVMEQLLYACCLENSKPEAADEAFARLQEMYFDWNEIRVTSGRELSEVMASLADPLEAATRLRRSLQSIFETHYAFDIEFLKKQNLGKAVKAIESFDGVSPFALAYVTQHGLGGHAIPVNRGAFQALAALDVISQKEAAKEKVPGLERAIPKSKGGEFASLLHQLGVDFLAAPTATRMRNLLAEIDPDVKTRLPKRGARSGEAAEAEATPKRPARKTTRGKQAPADKEAEGGKTAKKKAARKKPAATTKKAAAAAKKKSPTSRLSKKKPR